MATFLKTESIKGNVTANGYKDWIALDSVNFDIGRMAQMEVGEMHNRSSGKPSFNAVTIYKKADAATNAFFEHVLDGKNLREMTMDICSTGKTLKPHARYVLKDVIVSHFDTHVDSSGIPYERIQLSFANIEVHYMGQDSAGNAKAPIRSGYDLKTGELM